MILAPARVHPDASARVRNGIWVFNFHKVSEPICGSLPVFDVEEPTQATNPGFIYARRKSA